MLTHEGTIESNCHERSYYAGCYTVTQHDHGDYVSYFRKLVS